MLRGTLPLARGELLLVLLRLSTLCPALISHHLSNTQRRGKHSFVNNGGTRDLKRNEPLRDCDLSLNLVGSASNALFSALEPKQ